MPSKKKSDEKKAKTSASDSSSSPLELQEIANFGPKSASSPKMNSSQKMASSTSSGKDLDVNDLEHNLQEIVDELIPFLRENMAASCNEQFLGYLRKLLLTLSTSKCTTFVQSQGAQNADQMSDFFQRQLSTILDDTLVKFQGQK